MRKASVCFLLVLCSTVAFAQQQPQWTVVSHLTLLQQNEMFVTTLVTPTEPSLFRITVHFSGGQKGGRGGFDLVLLGTDILGQQVGGQWHVSCNGNGDSSVVIPTMLKPQAPLQLQVSDGNGDYSLPTCQYNLAIAVEQLVQQQ